MPFKRRANVARRRRRAARVGHDDAHRSRLGSLESQINASAHDIVDAVAEGEGRGAAAGRGRRGRKRECPRAKIHIEIFELDRHVIPYRVFEAAAERPTGCCFRFRTLVADGIVLADWNRPEPERRAGIIIDAAVRFHVSKSAAASGICYRKAVGPPPGAILAPSILINSCRLKKSLCTLLDTT
jgi:hypothetical protein